MLANQDSIFRFRLLSVKAFLQKNAPVAQLDRVPDFGSGGWGFEPSRAYKNVKPPGIPGWLFFEPFILPENPIRANSNLH